MEINVTIDREIKDEIERIKSLNDGENDVMQILSRIYASIEIEGDYELKSQLKNQFMENIHYGVPIDEFYATLMKIERDYYEEKIEAKIKIMQTFERDIGYPIDHPTILFVQSLVEDHENILKKTELELWGLSRGQRPIFAKLDPNYMMKSSQIAGLSIFRNVFIQDNEHRTEIIMEILTFKDTLLFTIVVEKPYSQFISLWEYFDEIPFASSESDIKKKFLIWLDQYEIAKQFVEEYEQEREKKRLEQLEEIKRRKIEDIENRWKSLVLIDRQDPLLKEIKNVIENDSINFEIVALESLDPNEYPLSEKMDIKIASLHSKKEFGKNNQKIIINFRLTQNNYISYQVCIDSWRIEQSLKPKIDMLESGKISLTLTKKNTANLIIDKIKNIFSMDMSIIDERLRRRDEIHEKAIDCLDLIDNIKILFPYGMYNTLKRNIYDYNFQIAKEKIEKINKIKANHKDEEISKDIAKILKLLEEIIDLYENPPLFDLNKKSVVVEEGKVKKVAKKKTK